MNRFMPLLVSVIVLVAAIAGYVFLSVQIRQAASAASAATENVSATGKQESFQRSIWAFMQDTERERAELATFVAKDNDIVTLIETIENAAKREKVSATIGSVSVSAVDWKYHEPLEVSLSAQGSFAALAAFATDLESLPQASRLSRMTVEASDKNLWFGTFTVEFVKEKTQSSQTP